MRIRTKITLLVTTLIAVVVLSIVANLIWVEQRKVQSDSATQIDALMDGVMRIGRESVASKDELMLLSYLKFLMKERPEIEIAMVSRADHSAVIGEIRSELFYKTVTISEIAAASYKATSELPPAQRPAGAEMIGRSLPPQTLVIQIGFSKTALDQSIRQAQLALLGKILGVSAIGLILGVAGSLWVARLLARPVARLALATQSFGEGNLDTVVEVTGKDEIADLARRFNDMASKTRELIRSKEDLMSTLTHELNTPMGGLKGFLEYIQETDKTQRPEERQEAYRTMLEAVSQMELSLANALQLFRTGAQPVLRLEHLRINDMLNEVIRLFAPTAQSSGVLLKGPLSTAPGFLWADKELMRRVAVNLVSNALKYTQPNGRVEVDFEDHLDHVHISVSDTGPGIAPEDRERIFTKFFRAAGPGGRQQRIPGTGLGLAISKQAVELHGGKIWVESEIGQGSVFHVTIPKKGGAHATSLQRA